MSLTKHRMETQGVSPSEKLTTARNRIRTASRAVQANEGRLLDYETAEDLQRTLHTAMRELEQLSITVAVMERRANL